MQYDEQRDHDQLVCIRPQRIHEDIECWVVYWKMDTFKHKLRGGGLSTSIKEPSKANRREFGEEM